MTSPYYLAMAALLGLVTTSSSLIGAAIGLHAPFSKRPQAQHLTLCCQPLKRRQHPLNRIAVRADEEAARLLGILKSGLNRNRRSPVMSVLPKST